MSKQSSGNWMICYDIADPKRLQSVHRVVSHQAVRIQYSVYYLQADTIELEQLLVQLSDKIDHKEDDIRVYPLPEKPGGQYLGHDKITTAILRSGAKTTLLYCESDEITPDA